METRREAIARQISREKYKTEASCSLLYQEIERSARRIDASQCFTIGMEQHKDGRLGPSLRCQGRYGHAGDSDLGPATGLQWATVHVPIFAQCHRNIVAQIELVWANHTQACIAMQDQWFTDAQARALARGS